jgi:hypothetical protein
MFIDFTTEIVKFLFAQQLNEIALKVGLLAATESRAKINTDPFSKCYH